ncbi:4-hydroxy-tetrahydrodipicolinate synthase [Rubeoparvulum massiliense]|uniref:4-hydroxy-tetrahydrodipicolinate synthase n=1 Tax=Rubeoparvulum massiliense TaxID=1631346 RepID=UPI00065E819F|nr:4-hydroxy-tetrahydrodipicolinate synthase [Rubeoparvulum massiliense]
MSFGRLLTAMVTPFQNTGEIDYDATTQLVEHLLATGTDALVVGGTTGEAPTLSHEEKLQFFRHVKEVVKNRVPVIAGTGSNDTRASIQLTQEVEELGVDGVMLVTPYYNKPSQAGIIQHVTAIAQATKLPIMLYNIPGRTGTNMTVDTIVTLSTIPNVVAVKEASGDLTQMGEILARTASDFVVYSGDDKLTLPLLAIGGEGVVSVASHLIGEPMQQMIQRYLMGEVKEAAQLHQQLLHQFEALFIYPNPVPVKALLAEYGLPVGSVRLPLVPLTEEERVNLLNRWKQ